MTSFWILLFIICLLKTGSTGENPADHGHYTHDAAMISRLQDAHHFWRQGHQTFSGFYKARERPQNSDRAKGTNSQTSGRSRRGKKKTEHERKKEKEQERTEEQTKTNVVRTGRRTRGKRKTQETDTGTIEQKRREKKKQRA